MEDAVKTRMTLAVVLIFLSGCAMSPSGAARTVPDAGPVAATFAGTWTGTIMSQEMASAAGLVEAPARLTLAEDGRWTLTSTGLAASGAARRTPRGLVLDGTVTSGDPMAVGRNLSFVLEPRGAGALFGDGETFYLGHRIDSAILLRRG
jgi:hypothetical protein